MCLVMSAVIAASAAAEVRTGSTTDPVDPDVQAGLDIVAVSTNYDSGSGTITASVTSRGAIETEGNSGVSIAMGTLDGTECKLDLFVLGAFSDPPAGIWSYGESSASAAVSVSGSTTTLSTEAASALAGQPFNCALAFSFGNGGSSIRDMISAPIQMAAAPPPPATAPAPAPAAPPPPPPPVKPGPKVKRAASLSVSAPAPTLRRNAWKKVKVTIANGGTGTATKVALTLGKAKGVAVKPKARTLKLKSIAPGKSKTATFRVMLTRKAKASSKLTLAVTGAKGVKAAGTLTIKAWKKPTGHKKTKKNKKRKPTPNEPMPTPAPAPLAGKIFYRLQSQPSESAKLEAIAFIDGTWAYNGMPAGGLPSCSATTGGAETEGCVKYTYDAGSGAVQLEKVGNGTLNGEGFLEIGEKSYSPTSTPAPGTTLQVEQEYVGYYGLCGPFSTCTTWHEYLTLTSSGEFILSRESLSTSEGAGTFTAAGSYPPDQHGTYAIESGARIRLSFADGTSQTKTIAILLNKQGQPDPVGEGLLLDSSYFTFANTR